MQKKDWLIICGVLLLALLTFGVSRLVQPAVSGATVTVYVGGSVYARVSASDYQTITIEQDDDTVNVVIVDESGVHMESSTCKNQLCVHQGVLDPHASDEIMLGNWIICMPNGVSIEVSGGEGAQ